MLIFSFGSVSEINKKKSDYWISIYGSRTDVQNPLGYETSQGMDIDENGNTYLAGFGYIDYSSNTNSDALLVKLDNFGELVFQKSYSVEGVGAEENWLYGVSADTDNDRIFIHGQSGGGSHPNFWNYYFVTAMNDSGTNILWSKRAGDGTPEGSFKGFHHQNNAIDSSKNFYTVVVKTLQPQLNVYEYRYYITKFNSSGAVQWVRRPYSAQNGFYDKLTVDQSGNVFCGYDLSPTKQFPEADAHIIKLNSSGTLQWSKVLTTPEPFYSAILGMTPDNLGGVIAVGYVSTTDYENYMLYGFVTYFNSSGSPVWSRRVDSALFRGAAVGPDGSIYVFGRDDTNPQISNNNILIKLSSSGNVMWQRNISGINPGFNYEVRVNQNNDIYIPLSQFNENGQAFSAMGTIKIPGDGSMTGSVTSDISYLPSSLTVFSSIPLSWSNESVTIFSESIAYTNAISSIIDESIEHERKDIR